MICTFRLVCSIRCLHFFTYTKNSTNCCEKFISAEEISHLLFKFQIVQKKYVYCTHEKISEIVLIFTYIQNVIGLSFYFIQNKGWLVKALFVTLMSLRNVTWNQK